MPKPHHIKKQLSPDMVEELLIAEQKRLMKIYHLGGIPGGANNEVPMYIQILPHKSKLSDKARETARTQADNIGILASEISHTMKASPEALTAKALYNSLIRLRAAIKPAKSFLGFINRYNESNKALLEIRKNIDSIIKIVEKQCPKKPKISLTEKIKMKLR